jgi:hypothetical protein
MERGDLTGPFTLKRLITTYNGDGTTEGSVDSDIWILPELGGVSVKEISYSPDGSLSRTEETYSLEFGEPDPQLVRLPGFTAVDDTRDEKKK